MHVEDIARICHEANRAYCMTLGDVTQPPWENAPDWQRQSAIDGVRNYLAHPEITPSESHNHWMDVKAQDGWVYGPIKDALKKEHPCMLPYDLLPLEQRMKDVLFLGIVRTLAEFLGGDVHDSL